MITNSAFHFNSLNIRPNVSCIASNDSLVGISKPIFSSTHDVVKIKGRRILHETRFFRDDINWKDLAKRISQNFPDGARIICHAGSDGTEAYSLAIALMQQMGRDKAVSMFPIESKDFAQNIIDKANKRIVPIYDYEMEDVEKFLGGKSSFKKYFTKADSVKYPDRTETIGFNHSKVLKSYYYPSEELKKAVNFEKADIIADAQSGFIDSKHSSNNKPIILLARNFTSYLTADENKELISGLKTSFNNLPKGSWLITGSLESVESETKLGKSFDDLLEEKGFKEQKAYSHTKDAWFGDKCIPVKLKSMIYGLDDPPKEDKGLIKKLFNF